MYDVVKTYEKVSAEHGVRRSRRRTNTGRSGQTAEGAIMHQAQIESPFLFYRLAILATDVIREPFIRTP